MKHKEEDKKFADLAMKITGERSLWTLRSWVLLNMLKELGINADWVLKANMDTLADLFEEQAVRLNRKVQ